MFIDKTAAIYIVDGWIKDENVLSVVNHWYWLIHGSSILYAKNTKRCGNEKPSSSLFQNDFNWNAHYH